MLEVISFNLEETCKGDTGKEKNKRTVNIRFVSFL